MGGQDRPIRIDCEGVHEVGVMKGVYLVSRPEEKGGEVVAKVKDHIFEGEPGELLIS
jgi:hypothetical protein